MRQNRRENRITAGEQIRSAGVAGIKKAAKTSRLFLKQVKKKLLLLDVLDAGREARNFARCGLLVDDALAGGFRQFRLGCFQGSLRQFLVTGLDRFFNLAEQVARFADAVFVDDLALGVAADAFLGGFMEGHCKKSLSGYSAALNFWQAQNRRFALYAPGLAGFNAVYGQSQARRQFTAKYLNLNAITGL